MKDKKGGTHKRNAKTAFGNCFYKICESIIEELKTNKWSVAIASVIIKQNNYKGGTYMEKDFEDFIVTRCENALLNNHNYLEHEHGNSAPEEAQDIAQIICYKQGFKDAMNILTCSQ